jgi:hypothetical protein
VRCERAYKSTQLTAASCDSASMSRSIAARLFTPARAGTKGASTTTAGGQFFKVRRTELFSAIYASQQRRLIHQVFNDLLQDNNSN